jgi:hypothetical protein
MSVPVTHAKARLSQLAEICKILEHAKTDDILKCVNNKACKKLI